MKQDVKYVIVKCKPVDSQTRQDVKADEQKNKQKCNRAGE